jgi:hypothetical protein
VAKRSQLHIAQLNASWARRLGECVVSGGEGECVLLGEDEAAGLVGAEGCVAARRRGWRRCPPETVRFQDRFLVAKLVAIESVRGRSQWNLILLGWQCRERLRTSTNVCERLQPEAALRLRRVPNTGAYQEAVVGTWLVTAPNVR